MEARLTQENVGVSCTLLDTYEQSGLKINLDVALGKFTLKVSVENSP